MRRSGGPSDRRRNNSKVSSAVRECVKIIVFEQCDGLCWLCESDVDPRLVWPHPMSAVMDHLVEFAAGGTYHPENLLLAHKLCNEERGRGNDVAFAVASGTV